MKINPLKLSEPKSGRNGVGSHCGPSRFRPIRATFRWTPSSVAEGHRSAYFKDGEIHVNVLGEPEGKPLTTGHWDFKPSWSKTGDKLVFFRRVQNHPQVGMWKTAICIINADGTGFHQITDATQTNFNQTWTRDGKTLRSGTERTRKAGDTTSWRGRSEENPGRKWPLPTRARTLGPTLA